MVIGKGCGPTSSGPVSETDALDYVFGYTIGNDVSERYWQRNDRTMWRAKNTDTFKPMGPWIVTDLNPDDLHVIIRVNDSVVGEYDVATALFGVRNYIRRNEQIPHAGSWRRPVDGHRGCHREHEGRRPLRDRDQRDRHPQQPRQLAQIAGEFKAREIAGA